MGFLNIIRRMSLREKLSIREIRRRTGLSRNTIAKYLNAGTVEPTFATPDRVSKLDPFAEKLSGWLKAEASKSRKERRTAKQLYADLVTLGFTGSYGRVAAFARDWRADRQQESQTTGRGTFVPLTFRPGEAFQFDWSEDFAVLGGERTKRAMWPISSCRTPRLSSCGLTFFRPMRCCLTPTGMVSASLAASLNVAFTIVRLGRHRFEARPNEDGGGPHWPGQGTEGQLAVPRHDEPLCLRASVLQSGLGLGEGTGREECSGFPSSALATDARLP